MTIPFFALLGTRLGLRFAPIGHDELNIGVEAGALTIYNHLQNKQNHEVPKFAPTFPAPENIAGENYLTTVFEYYNELSTQLANLWPADQKLITVGGDHSVAYISLQAVLKRFGAPKVGVVMFDSHADLHLLATSPSGNFHGMWLRTFFDHFHENKSEVPQLQPNQLIYVGNLLTETEESKFIEENKIQVIDSNSVSESSVQKILTWVEGFDHLHISFDIDVFAEDLSPATGTPNPNGFTKENVFTILKPLLDLPSVSLDIIEFNPKKNGAEQSLALIENIVSLF